MSKTLYIWDLAGTLFPEKWNKEKSGLPDYRSYVQSLGYNLKTITPREWELAYENPYRKGLFDLAIADGFSEVLSWTNDNAAFTTGNREQLDWRAEQLQKKYSFDIRDNLKEIYSTFDYGETNLKTPEMIKDILVKKRKGGYTDFVYTDDKLENVRFFLGAAGGHRVRAYHMKNDGQGLREKDGCWQIGNLYDMMKNEKLYV